MLDVRKAVLIVIEGANLFPVGFLQPGLVALQTLVYGLSKQRNQGKEVRLSQQTEKKTEIITEVVPDAWFGQHIPLERFNLQRRSECVRTRRWEAYITIGTKV